MKKILSFVFLFYCLCASAQIPPATKIIFEYSKGHNPWGSTGIYSRSERFELLPIHGNKFKITRHRQIVATALDSSDVKYDTTIINPNHYKLISTIVIDSLYNQLHTTKDNFTFAFIRPRLKMLAKRQIMKIAAISDKYSKDDYYVSLLKDGAMINKIKDFDKLDNFIKSKKPNPENAFVIVDAWDAIRVYYITNKDTEKYHSEFHQLLGQPFEKIGPNNNGVVNIEINEIIAGLLPNSSLLKKRIEINSLTDEYISWYIYKGRKIKN